ncbi:hypothetical protein OG875_03140 [Streptomyces sp. NBC_01498]|uniref:hypothetical protein n=1 Tax=Streptomyces sp. NBC_01498 TaxID=2975870 RepID=UPI002E7B0533|nr:hypothetical protein [Streptomyces sp. NBC_01498]WTL23681.1 hypothetical protein OG875_03140 [Streptomyces sp. NBC_01498]
MKFVNVRNAVALALAAAFMFGATGCAGETERIESVQIPGVWTGAGGGRVEFGDDGRFELSGIPSDAVVFSFIDPPPKGEKVSGQGTWSVKRKGSIVGLIYDSTGSFAEGGEAGTLGVADGGDSPKLYFSTSSDREYGYEIHKSG